MGRESMDKAGPFLTQKRRVKLKTKESKKVGGNIQGENLRRKM
jgi:hypothetical protein